MLKTKLQFGKIWAYSDKPSKAYDQNIFANVWTELVLNLSDGIHHIIDAQYESINGIWYLPS